jgi:adenylate cyclase
VKPLEAQSGAELVHQVDCRLARLAWIASAVGAIFVFNSIGFLIPIFLDPDERTRLALTNAPAIIAYLAVFGFLIRRHTARHLRETLRWIVEDREPDEREHRRTLNLALYGVKFALLGWIAAIPLFAALSVATQSWGWGAVVGATVWCGAETTCALIYLASERILRPVTARALAVGPAASNVAPGVRGRLVMAWLLCTGVPLLGVLVVSVVGIAKPDVHSQYVASAALFLGGVAMVVGLLATVFAAKAIAEPLTAVRDGLEQIRGGDLDAKVAVDDGSEVGLVQAGFNRMAEGLRERSRIRELFGFQVGEDVARAALREGARLGGEEREIGALFVDIVGSTSMALDMPPTQVVQLLNRFFTVVVEVVEDEGGLVDKFQGDAAMCVFGTPVSRDDPAGDALRAARRLAERLSTDVPEIDFGVGISAGIAVAGNVGAEHRFEYTVIGDPVNEACRLSELAKQRPCRVLASSAALERASEEESVVWSVYDSEVLRGRGVATEVAQPR